MLQRYDLVRNDKTNRFSIKEFAVLETRSHKRVDYKPSREDYSLIHEVSYDSKKIRAAILEGQDALISVLRSGDFFPIYPYAKIIARGVIEFFNGKSDKVFELQFDDRTLLSTYAEDQDKTGN